MVERNRNSNSLIRIATRAIIDQRLGNAEELVQTKRFVQDRLAVQPSLSRFHDGVSRVVPESCHERHRDNVHELLEPNHELVTGIIGKFDVGDDHIVMLIAAVLDHRDRLITTVCCLDGAPIAFEQRMRVVANAFIRIDHENSPTDQLCVTIRTTADRADIGGSQGLADLLDRLLDASSLA